MTYAYFPGCTLKTQAADLDRWGRVSMEALGITLEELPQWQCCGAVYPLAKDEIASRLSSVRALMDARALNRPLVTLCSACHHVIKRTNCDFARDETFRDRANTYLAPETPYAGETQVLHYLEVLRDAVGFDNLAKQVKNPLTGKKIGAYYGCLLLRPSRQMAFDDPENPTIMEDFIRAIGAEPVIYAQRNECCGGYVTLEDRSLARTRAAAVEDNAAAQGAETLTTACPLCLYNLQKNGGGKLPVVYFTELLAQALGLKEEAQ